jgi:hypothetical protein
MIKKLFVLAMLGVATLAQANSFTICSGVNGYNNYNCTLNSSSFTGGEISGCTFTFNSCFAPWTGALSCNLKDSTSSWNCGSSGSSSWSCTLDQSGCDYLNKCLASGSCDFNLFCGGSWHCGSCTITYTCKPPKNNVPDTATTIYALGLALLALEVTRRKLVVAKAK